MLWRNMILPSYLSNGPLTPLVGASGPLCRNAIPFEGMNASCQYMCPTVSEDQLKIVPPLIITGMCNVGYAITRSVVQYIFHLRKR